MPVAEGIIVGAVVAALATAGTETGRKAVRASYKASGAGPATRRGVAKAGKAAGKGARRAAKGAARATRNGGVATGSAAVRRAGPRWERRKRSPDDEDLIVRRVGRGLGEPRVAFLRRTATPDGAPMVTMDRVRHAAWQRRDRDDAPPATPDAGHVAGARHDAAGASSGASWWRRDAVPDSSSNTGGSQDDDDSAPPTPYQGDNHVAPDAPPRHDASPATPRPGDRLTHPSLGSGTVAEVRGDGVALVQYDSGTVATVSLKNLRDSPPDRPGEPKREDSDMTDSAPPPRSGVTGWVPVGDRPAEAQRTPAATPPRAATATVDTETPQTYGGFVHVTDGIARHLGKFSMQVLELGQRLDVVTGLDRAIVVEIMTAHDKLDEAVAAILRAKAAMGRKYAGSVDDMDAGARAVKQKEFFRRA